MKSISLFFILCFTLLASVARVTIVKGDVYLIRNTVISVLKSGEELEEKDKIQTKKASRAQIIFKDQTIVTLGSNTNFSINDYVNTNKNKKVNLSVTRGFFKTITGKIGKIAPSRFKLKTRTATIGIRGTYFSGNISPKQESIGCLRGAIAVQVGGEKVDVEAGSMVVLKPGKKAVLKKLDASASQESSSSLTQEVPKETKLLKISPTKTEEVKEDTSLQDYIDSQLKTAFKNSTDLKFARIDVENIYLTGYQTSTSYVPLKWGFRALNEPSETLSLSNAQDVLNQAHAFDTYILRNDDTIPEFTDEKTIKDFIGYNQESEEAYEYWDGRATNRKLMTYSGKVIAVSNSNALASASKFPDDYDLDYFSVISPTAVNSFNLYVDYGNRLWYGKMKFDIKNAKSSDTEEYTFYFLSLGNSALDSSGLNQLLFFKDAKTPPLSKQTDLSKDDYPMKGSSIKYYGDKAQQIAGIFTITRADNSLVYGQGILSNQSSYTMQKIETESDNIFKWGYWAQSSSNNIDDESILATSPQGGWIIPQDGITQTTESEINALINANATANYSAQIIGTVHDPITALINDQTQNTSLIKDGTADFSFDFGTQKFDAKISFSDGDSNWEADIQDAKITTSGFSADRSNLKSDTSNVVDIQLNGKFYAQDAKYIGGGFEMIDERSHIAIGAFKGTKK